MMSGSWTKETVFIFFKASNVKKDIRQSKHNPTSNKNFKKNEKYGCFPILPPASQTNNVPPHCYN